MSATLQKALFLFEVSPNKFGNELHVQYNPENISVSQGTSWQKQSVSNNSGITPIQYQGTNPRVISMDLIFDLTHGSASSGDIYTMFCLHLQNAMIPQIDCERLESGGDTATAPAPAPAPSGGGGQNGAQGAAAKTNIPPKRPPKIEFHWGNMHIVAVLKTMKSEFTMFAPDGKAVRAKISITLEEFQSGLADPNKAGDMSAYNIDQVKLVQVQQGQTLSALAQMAGISTAALADLNGIDNPLDVSAGSFLKLPL